jgi:RHS repeat-associated protein
MAISLCETHQLLSRTTPDGAIESWTRDSLDLVLTHTDQLGRVTAYTRDDQHRMTRIDYPDGSFETFSYNGFSQALTHTMRNGGVETFTYDARGLKTSSTDPLGNVTTYTYDASDRLASVTDARTNTISYQYTSRGQVTTMTYPDGNFQSYTYDIAGNRTAVTNELGKTWTYAYDEFKRPIQTTDPLNRATQYKYDLPGNVCGCSHSQAKPTLIILPSGKQIAITYDMLWRKVSETLGAGTADAATTSYAYDAVGNLTTVTDPRGKVWASGFDNRNRQITATDPLGNQTQRTYDTVGNNLTETRPDNGVITNVYDSMDRVTRTTDPKNQATQFSYDNADNMTSLTDARNNTYGFTYDLLRRKISMIYPDNSHEDYSYDPVGNVATYTARAGEVRTYAHDNRNRETQSQWSDGTPTITRSYDAASRMVTLNNSISNLSYTYDDANEMFSETQQIAAGFGPKVVSYAYDADGNRASLTYPSGSVVTSAYTNRNQVASITADGPPPMATYSYDLNGNRTAKSLENNTSTTYAYDNANRVTSIAHFIKLNAAPFTISFHYSYNAVGDRTSVQREDSKADLYGYDAIDQITGVQYDTVGGVGADRQVSYTYDATGNRAQVMDSGAQTNYTSNNLNQYTQVGVGGLGYDVNGNLRSQSGWTYTYDAQNRMLSATNGTTTATFGYDTRNRCVSRTINGTTMFFYFDGWNLIEDRNAADAQLRRYVHGAMVDEILAMISTTGSHFFHHDAITSVVAITDATGAIEERYSYDVYGVATIKNALGMVQSTSSAGNRFQFTGREYVPDLGLYDYRNRMYSQNFGRFLQTDQARFDAGDVNLYRYVANNPIRNGDPLGLCCEEEKRAVNEARKDWNNAVKLTAAYAKAVIATRTTLIATVTAEMYLIQKAATCKGRVQCAIATAAAAAGLIAADKAKNANKEAEQNYDNASDAAKAAQNALLAADAALFTCLTTDPCCFLAN